MGSAAMLIANVLLLLQATTSASKMSRLPLKYVPRTLCAEADTYGKLNKIFKLYLSALLIFLFYELFVCLCSVQLWLGTPRLATRQRSIFGRTQNACITWTECT